MLQNWFKNRRGKEKYEEQKHKNAKQAWQTDQSGFPPHVLPHAASFSLTEETHVSENASHIDKFAASLLNTASASSPPSNTPGSSLHVSGPDVPFASHRDIPGYLSGTTNQLNAEGDEYLDRDTDSAGEQKVTSTGHLTAGREYRCRTFLVPGRGDKLFMLAIECAKVLVYRDSYLIFTQNPSLYRIVLDQAEKDHLIKERILPYSHRSQQIAMVTARSMFRRFGARIIRNARRVRDDYWEHEARKQGFTEEDRVGVHVALRDYNGDNTKPASGTPQ